MTSHVTVVVHGVGSVLSIRDCIEWHYDYGAIQ